MTLNRRQLLANVGVLSVGGILAACANKTATGGGTVTNPPTTQPAQLANYASLIAAGILSLSPTLSSLGLSQANVSLVDGIATDVQKAVSDFEAADTNAAQKTVVQRVVADVNAFLGDIVSVEAQLPAGAVKVIDAIKTMAPYLETMVGVAITVFGARRNQMDVNEAVAVLQQAKASHH